MGLKICSLSELVVHVHGEPAEQLDQVVLTHPLRQEAGHGSHARPEQVDFGLTLAPETIKQESETVTKYEGTNKRLSSMIFSQKTSTIGKR